MRKKYDTYSLLALLATLLILGNLFIVVNKQTTQVLAQRQSPLPTPHPPLMGESQTLGNDLIGYTPSVFSKFRAHPPQASQTNIIYQLPVVKFRVDSGDDLDQYLSAVSSPLDFYIDLQGFTPPVTQTTQVTLKVWDIDEAGNPNNPTCLVEVDKV